MNKALNEQEREMFCDASAETPQREEAELKLWKRVRSLVRDDQDEIKKIADQQIQKREAELLDLWEILVPVASNEGIPFSEDHHEAFRRILRALPGNSGTTSRPVGDGDTQVVGELHLRMPGVIAVHKPAHETHHDHIAKARQRRFVRCSSAYQSHCLFSGGS
jgi:hypothetical protein